MVFRILGSEDRLPLVSPRRTYRARGGRLPKQVTPIRRCRRRPVPFRWRLVHVRLCAQTTMIYDGTPHRIFRISELTRLIASQLTLISPKSTASLACACRHLEEPVLSSLWQTQQSLDTLLKVLPGETWRCDNSGPGTSVVRGPDPPFENSSAQVGGYFSSGS